MSVMKRVVIEINEQNIKIKSILNIYYISGQENIRTKNNHEQTRKSSVKTKRSYQPNPIVCVCLYECVYECMFVCVCMNLNLRVIFILY